MVVLLVDDNESDLALIQMILRRQDPTLTLLERHTCQEAMDLARKQTIDCIVMDQSLIGPSGVDCIKDLREHAYRDAFLLLTGLADTDQSLAVKAITNGADGFLLKDDAEAKLLAAIHAAIASRAEIIQTQLQAEAREHDLEQLADKLDQIKEKVDPHLEPD